jgi:hypothetical protein
MFGNDILNSYGKNKAEDLFARAYPGSSLKIGELDYSVVANRLVVLSVTLNSSNSTLKAGRVSIAGIRWWRLIWGKPALTVLLTKASLEADNLDMQFTKAKYGVRCARLRGSVPASELLAQGVYLSPLINDSEIFAPAFRTTRFRVYVAECKVSGLAYGELLEGSSYRAGTITISRPYFDIFVDRYKPVEPFVKSPLMAQEALASIDKPVQVDTLNITDGYLKYAEQVVAGAAPGVLTISKLNILAHGIANRSKAATAIRLQAQGNLMNAGLIKVVMTIPIGSPGFSLNYSGSLGAMDMTRLNAFLSNAEQLRIKSGSIQEVVFKINVANGQASGRVKAVYKDLRLAVRDKITGSEMGLKNQIASLLMNNYKIQSTKSRDAAGRMREAEVKYTRKPPDEFLQFVWFALRSGILTVISF